MKFEVGDTVIYTSGIYDESESNPLWEGLYGKIKGKIIKIDTNGFGVNIIHVRWFNGSTNVYLYNDLELIEHEQKTIKLFGIVKFVKENY